ncbi:MAG: DNA recombination/repair protein RecA [Gemmatimonadaceae bacterium]|jgi:hypothetical protein|nr:DNA recombination/repair protein RecA [Gemmatimonadaceae bacterium]
MSPLGLRHVDLPPPAGAAPDALAALRAHIADVVAGGKPSGPPRPTGVAPLDAALDGGIPRGRLTEIVGDAGSGITTLVHRCVARTLADGGWVAVIDASRTLAPREWGTLVREYGPRLWVVRPPRTEGRRAAWCADLLLRTGAFALVVLDGAPVVRRATGVRLAQLAREQDAALIAVRYGVRASDLGGAVRLRVTAPPAPVRVARTRPPGRTGPQLLQHAGEHGAQLDERPHERMHVVVERGGHGPGLQRVEVSCAVAVANRVCAHPEVPDRRGVARRTRHKWDVAGTTLDRSVAGGGAVAPPAAGAGAIPADTSTTAENPRIEITRDEAAAHAPRHGRITPALGRASARARRGARAQ